jgi:hypothetical protein
MDKIEWANKQTTCLYCGKVFKRPDMVKQHILRLVFPEAHRMLHPNLKAI